MKRLLGLGAAIAALTYFFDPQNGARRRNTARDRVLAFLRQSGRKAGRAGRAVASEAHGLKQKATHLKEEDKPQPDDVTLARKVESEVLGGDDGPKGSVVVNARDGVVELRGEVESPEDVKALGAAAERVAGVKDVNNLLHTPGSEPETSPVSDPDEVRERAEKS
jgi:osmotically-inducible protein OsmY